MVTTIIATTRMTENMINDKANAFCQVHHDLILQKDTENFEKNFKILLLIFFYRVSFGGILSAVLLVSLLSVVSRFIFDGALSREIVSWFDKYYNDRYAT